MCPKGEAFGSVFCRPFRGGGKNRQLKLSIFAGGVSTAQVEKFYQRIYKMTGCRYIDWLEKAREFRRFLKKGNPPEHNLFFYGHSVDIVYVAAKTARARTFNRTLPE